MTHEQMIERLQAECNTLVDTVRRKNNGYGNDSAGPFHNFNIIEFLTDGHITAEVGIIVRCTDKLARAYNLMAGQSDLVGEPLADTLRDLAAYSLLALIAHDAKQDVPVTESDLGMNNLHDYTGSTQGYQLGLAGSVVKDSPEPLNEKQKSAWETLCAAFRG